MMVKYTVASSYVAQVWHASCVTLKHHSLAAVGAFVGKLDGCRADTCWNCGPRAVPIWDEQLDYLLFLTKPVFISFQSRTNLTGVVRWSVSFICFAYITWAHSVAMGKNSIERGTLLIELQNTGSVDGMRWAQLRRKLYGLSYNRKVGNKSIHFCHIQYAWTMMTWSLVVFWW